MFAALVPDAERKPMSFQLVLCGIEISRNLLALLAGLGPSAGNLSFRKALQSARRHTEFQFYLNTHLNAPARDLNTNSHPDHSSECSPWQTKIMSRNSACRGMAPSGIRAGALSRNSPEKTAPGSYTRR
jgi:hypothetical protein